MNVNTLTIQACGGSGDGTIVTGMLLAKSMVKIGYHVFIHDIFPAEIRGRGKTISEVRISTEKVSSQSDSVDILLGLNNAFATEQIEDLNDTCTIIYDSKSDASVHVPDFAGPKALCHGIPIEATAQRIVKTKLGKNMVALGFLAKLLNLKAAPFTDAIQEIFARKGEKIVNGNVKLFMCGFDFEGDYKKISLQPPPQTQEKHSIISGNDVIALGAMNGGLEFFAGYPITPATKIMEKLALELPKRGGTVLQTEDEISSAGAAMGAWFTGKRAMTATSGPGFALMTEMIGLSTMTETPLVVINVMRAGPSTGQPTKTEQSDLNLILFGGHGDSPRVVLAPTTIGECYHITQDALDIAEKYQTPVIVLSDRFLAMSHMDVSEDVLQGTRVPTREKYHGAPENYKRYQITESGVSPWVFPGEMPCTYTITGLEHTEEGHPSHDPDMHHKMTEKRYRKFNHMLDSLPKPEFFGDEDAPNLIITWGSVFSSINEATERLRREGYKARVVKMKTLFPQHKEIMEKAFEGVEKIIIPEQNRSAQLARMIKGYYGIKADEVQLPGSVSIRPQKAMELLKDRLVK